MLHLFTLSISKDPVQTPCFTSHVFCLSASSVSKDPVQTPFFTSHVLHSSTTSISKDPVQTPCFTSRVFNLSASSVSKDPVQTPCLTSRVLCLCTSSIHTQFHSSNKLDYKILSLHISPSNIPLNIPFNSSEDNIIAWFYFCCLNWRKEAAGIKDCFTWFMARFLRCLTTPEFKHGNQLSLLIDHNLTGSHSTYPDLC